MKPNPKPIWVDGDPYVFDAEGEITELHHGEHPS